MPHRLRLPIALAAALTGVSAFAAIIPAHASGPISYVALGDSYSSGDGAGNYSGGSCLESANAYPVLWHSAHGGSFTNETCAGATPSTRPSSRHRAPCRVRLTARCPISRATPRTPGLWYSTTRSSTTCPSHRAASA